MSANGKVLAVVGSDDVIKLWSLPDGSPLGTLATQQKGVIALALSQNGDKVVTSGSDRAINVSSVAKKELLFNLQGHKEAAYSLSVSPDGSVLVSSARDAVKVWSLKDGSLLYSQTQQGISFTNYILSPDGNTLAISNDNSTITALSLPGGQLVNTLEGHTKPPIMMRITSDGKTLISASDDNTIRIWSLPEGKLLNTLQGHGGEVIHPLDITEDGKILVTAGADKAIRIWSLPEGTFLGCFLDLAANPSNVKGTKYSTTSSSGQTVEYTLPCGSSVPAGAVCVCNCVAGTGGCACVGNVGSSGGGSYSYWYPNLEIVFLDWRRPMEVFAIPLDDKFIIYRPLLQLAFVGNQALADLTLRIGQQNGVSDGAILGDVPEEVANFLQSINFLEPDPLPPPAPDHTFRPTQAVLLLTNACQLRCVYCYANGGVGRKRTLAFETAKAVIDEVCANAQVQGQPSFELAFHGGGEPVTAWKLVQEVTDYARNEPLPCSISITSNGIWSERQTRWIIDNLDKASLSVDGGPETQDRQRPYASGRGSSRTVFRTIAALDKAKLEYGIRLTATSPWLGRLPEDVRYICENTGCRSMQVEPAFNNARGEHAKPTEDQTLAFAEAFGEAFEIASRNGRQFTYSGGRPWLLTQAFCTAPYGALIVDPSGNLVSCYEVTNSDHPLAGISQIGMVHDGQVMVDQEARERLLNQIDERRAMCSGCFCRWHCAGDCYSRAFGQNGSHLEFGPRCLISRAITAQMLLWYIAQGDGVWQGQRKQVVRTGCC